MVNGRGYYGLAFGAIVGPICDMSSIATPGVIGRGASNISLSSLELREIVEQALADVTAGERVLAIIPDKTRDDNTHLLLPFTADILAAKRAGQFDALVAQGTHP